MKRDVVHVVVTDAFAGVERYVCSVASDQAGRGGQIAVVGGEAERMREALPGGVEWLPGGSLRTAVRSLYSVDAGVVHVHMTKAELVGSLYWRRPPVPLVATRHFGADRGSHLAGRLASRWIERRLDAEVAISEYVASCVRRKPDAVVVTGVPPRPATRGADGKIVLVAQRLEPEKRTGTALEAWALSGLADEGWSLRIAGSGAEERSLRECVEAKGIAGVAFLGWVPDVGTELAAAAMLIAPTPGEGLGLTVLEAMAAAVPVVAAGSGGHLETVGSVPSPYLFPVDDVRRAAELLRTLAADEQERARYGHDEQHIQRERFSVPAHVDGLERIYSLARRRRAGEELFRKGFA